MVGGPPKVATRKAVVDETFFGDLTNLCKVVSELMLVSFIFSVCVKQCQLVSTKDGNYIRNLSISSCVRTRPGVSKTWSCHTFIGSDHSVRMKVSTPQTHRKKLLHTVLMAFVDTATLCLNLRDAIINIARVEKLVLPSQRKKFREAFKRDS